MVWLPCSYLDAEVELTAERQHHIERRHPNVQAADIALALAEPHAAVVRPARPEELLVTRRIDDPDGSTHIVVAVVRDAPATDVDPPRHWVVTAYVAENLPIGTVVWRNS